MVKPMLALGSIELVGAEDILSHGIVKNILESPQGFGGKIMFNKVILIGRTTSDVDLRYTQGANQKAVGQVSLAVNRSYKNVNGDREADFIRLVVWGEQAERFASWIKKGSLVQVEGELRTRSYDDQQGKRVYVTEVLVARFNNLEKRDDSQNQQNQGFGQGFGNDAFGATNPLDISDDDLPF